MTPRIAFVTHDLEPGRARLMPWRTTIEVVRGMRRMGLDAWLISISPHATEPFARGDFEVPVWRCRSLRDLKNGNNAALPCPIHPDLVYWPVTWRSGLYLHRQWHGWDCPTLAYLGGGHYSLRQVLAAMRWMKVRPGLPYLIEAATPKRLLVRHLQNRGVRGIITMTEFNRRILIRDGWPRDQVAAVPPGLDGPAPADWAASDAGFWKQRIGDGPYVLFMGNPQPIRGVNVLLATAERLLSRHRDIRIVCLLRKDGGEAMAQAANDVLRLQERLKEKARFLCLTDTLDRHQVASAMAHARAVVLPFLIVPSEVPLSILESMQLGTPVIVTESGGTSEFVGDAGWIVPPANPAALAEAMRSAVQDRAIRQDKSRRALEKINSHPGWDEVARTWLDFGLRRAGIQ